MRVESVLDNKEIKVKWQFNSKEIEIVKKIIADQKNSCMVKKRYKENLAGDKEPVDRNAFWYEMVGSRMTSQQRSGPGSHVDNFLTKKPFPLNYETVKKENDRQKFMKEKLTDTGIRFSIRISEDLAENFNRLEGDLWEEVLKQCNSLIKANSSAQDEKKVADYIDKEFKGFGPKQSRNLLQSLGLTRYETPIDSRVMKWLNEELGFFVPVHSSALDDNKFYDFISQMIQELSKKAEVFPCVLDAAIFSLKDPGALPRD